METGNLIWTAGALTIFLAMGVYLIFVGKKGKRKIDKFVQTAKRYNAEIVDVNIEKVTVPNANFSDGNTRAKFEMYVAKARFIDKEGDEVFIKINFPKDKADDEGNIGDKIEVLYDPYMYGVPLDWDKIYSFRGGSERAKKTGCAFTAAIIVMTLVVLGVALKPILL